MLTWHQSSIISLRTIHIPVSYKLQAQQIVHTKPTYLNQIGKCKSVPFYEIILVELLHHFAHHMTIYKHETLSNAPFRSLETPFLLNCTILITMPVFQTQWSDSFYLYIFPLSPLSISHMRQWLILYNLLILHHRL